MDCRVIACFLMCGGFISAPAMADRDPPAVEVMEQLQVSGNRDISQEEILSQLKAHPRAIEAATHPTKEWHETARSLILSGYQSQGYADATVTIQEQNQLLIFEGPKYVAGEIRVSGATDSLVQAIRTHLNGPPPETPAFPASGKPASKPEITIKTNTQEALKKEGNEQPWKIGVSRHFNEEFRKHLEKLASQAFELDARIGGQLTVQFERDAAAALMNLRVEVTDAGQLMEVNEFEIEGLIKDTPEELINYLRLKPGPFSLADRRAVETRLRESARFLGHRTEMVAPFRSGDPYHLFIHVKECPGAPKLTVPFTPEQVSLLKVRDWLENFETHGQQWVIAASGDPAPNYRGQWHDGKYDLQLVLSPSHQYALRIESQRYTDGLVRGYLVGFGEKWISIASHQTGKQLLLERTPEAPRPFLTINFEGLDQPHQNNNVNLQFGYGVNSSNKKPPLTIRVAPAALLYAPVDEQPRKMWIEKGVLLVESEVAITRIDAESGRLLSSDFRHPVNPNHAALRFSTEPDNFDATWKAWVESGNFQVTGNADAPVTSLAEFVVEEMNQLDPQGAPARRAIMKLIGPDILAAVDQSYVKQRSNKKSSFIIPWEKAGWSAQIASLILKMEDRLLRPDSTAFELSQSLVRSILEDRPGHSQRFQQAVARPDCGPLNCVVFGTLASWSATTNSSLSSAGPLFGRMGLGRMNEKNFEDDLNQWLEPKQIIGQAAIRVVRRTRDLTDEEAASLVALCKNPKACELITEVLSELRKPVQYADPSDADVGDLQQFCSAITRLWGPIIRPLVAAQLIRLSAVKKKPAA